jgi:fatty-acyl-CoA synthase
VSSGQPIPGCRAVVLLEHGQSAPDGTIGEIAIQSGSLFDGYRNNPEKTAEVLRDGWYLSGDYGFRFEDEFYIIGRKKDVIIVAGKNIYPEDIEDALLDVPGVIPGRVVAFGAEDETAGTEQICVIVETEAADPEPRETIRKAIVQAGMQIDVTIARVYLAPPRWLIKSSAGKPSRSANRQRILEDQAWSQDARLSPLPRAA